MSYVPLHPGILAFSSAAARLGGPPRTKGLALASQLAHDRRRGSRQAHAAPSALLRSLPDRDDQMQRAFHVLRQVFRVQRVRQLD